MTQTTAPRRRLRALAAGALLLLVLPAAGAVAAEQTASLGAAQGTDGCYFGECPEPGAPAPKVPEQQAGPDWGDPQQSPWPGQPGPQGTTAICQTPTFWCVMGEVGPVGSDCWCADWYGYVYYGTTVPQ